MLNSPRRDLRYAPSDENASIKRIYLSGKFSNLYALVDESDYKEMSKIYWILHEKGYAVNPKHGRMHRLINKTPKGVQTDHKNGDKLDNRRANLRNATPSENQYNRKKMSNNTSGHKGVSWSKAAQKWHAYINKDGKRHYLGIFVNKNDAIKAYREAALLLHEDFMKL